MNLIIRGHIRKSFENTDLKNFIDEISQVCKVNVVIHTWKIFQSGLSWRRIQENNSNVTEDIIRSYFGKISESISSVIIDDESSLSISGRVVGTVGHTPCPILGYKYMFYGMMKAAEHVADQVGEDELVVQTRFDILSNWAVVDRKRMVEFFKKKPTKRIQFMMPEIANEDSVGIDNIYMAKSSDMRDFLRHMYNNLDEIDDRHKIARHMGHQEWLTMFEAQTFFNGRS